MLDLEQKWKLILESQELVPDDDLTRRLGGGGEEELSEDDLDFVSAAGSASYQRFLERLGGKD